MVLSWWTFVCSRVASPSNTCLHDEWIQHTFLRRTPGRGRITHHCITRVHVFHVENQAILLTKPGPHVIIISLKSMGILTMCCNTVASCNVAEQLMVLLCLWYDYRLIPHLGVVFMQSSCVLRWNYILGPLLHLWVFLYYWCQVLPLRRASLWDDFWKLVLHCCWNEV